MLRPCSRLQSPHSSITSTCQTYKKTTQTWMRVCLTHRVMTQGPWACKVRSRAWAAPSSQAALQLPRFRTAPRRSSAGVTATDSSACSTYSHGLPSPWSGAHKVSRTPSGARQRAGLDAIIAASRRRAPATEQPAASGLVALGASNSSDDDDDQPADGTTALAARGSAPSPDRTAEHIGPRRRWPHGVAPRAERVAAARRRVSRGRGH